MASPHVNNFYRIWFTWVDPLITGSTTLLSVLTPEAILDAFIPSSIWPLESHQIFLVHQLAILYGFMGIIFGVLLRASPDPKVWRIVQGATLAVDISILVSTYDALRRQGRLEMETWRPGDWFNVLFTLWVALIRVAYLAGIGGGKGAAKKRV